MKIPDIPDDEAPDEPFVVEPSAKWALAMTTAAGWPFLLAAQFGAFQVAAALRGLVFREAGVPADAGALLWLLVLPAFATPALSLAVRWGRERLVVRAALVTLLAGLAIAALVAANMNGAGFGPRAFAPPVIAAIAAGALYLGAIVGLANRRAVAGGLVGAWLIHQLMPGIGGMTGFALASALVCGLGIVATLLWARAPADDRSENFERRAGGLRLRGTLALGALLFALLDFDVAGPNGFMLAMPDSPGVALVGGIAMALAWLFVVRGIDVPRHRRLAMAGAITVTIGMFGAHFGGNLRVAAALLTLTASLMLLGRALAPSSGRRSGRFLVYGLLLYALLAVGEHVGRGGFVWTELWLATAGVALTVTIYLTPRPARSPSALPDPVAFGVAALIPILTFFIAR